MNKLYEKAHFVLTLPLTHLQVWYLWHTSPEQQDDLPFEAPHAFDFWYSLAHLICRVEVGVSEIIEEGLSVGNNSDGSDEGWSVVEHDRYS